MAKLVTQAEYARMRGVSREAVRRALLTQRVTGIPDAKGRLMVDPEVADIQWARNTDSTQQQRGAPEQFERTQERAETALSGSTTRGAAPAAPDAPEPTDNPLLVKAKTDTELIRRQLLELELRERSGELVRRDDFERAYALKLMTARDALEGIPDRIAAKVTAETDVNVVHALLTEELRLAMRSATGEAPAGVN